MKKLFFIFCLVASVNSHAALMFSGYKTSTAGGYDIVEGHGKQFLDFNHTLGMSVNDAITSFGSLGWSLATNADVVTLFNNFLADLSTVGVSTNLTTDEEFTQEFRGLEQKDTIADIAAVNFLSMFGYSFIAPQSAIPGTYIDKILTTRFVFGADANGDGVYNQARVSEYGTYKMRIVNRWIKSSAEFKIFGDRSSGIPADERRSWRPVLMTRDIPVAPPRPVADVSEPAVLGILSIGLASLFARRFKMNKLSS